VAIGVCYYIIMMDEQLIMLMTENVNQMVLFLLEIRCICAVDLFVLITKNFICKSDVSVEKYLKLYGEMQRFIVYLLFIIQKVEIRSEAEMNDVYTRANRE